MAHDSQLDIKQLTDGSWALDFPFNRDFIDWLKGRVPGRDRSYDSATNVWVVRGDEYLKPIESVGVQYFDHVTKLFYRDKVQVWKNLKTGIETVQKSLF